MTWSRSFQTYLEQFGLIGMEKRDKLAFLVQDGSHELDLDSGRIRFPLYEIPMQVLGTESDNTFTWLWAWADEQTEIPPFLIDAALQLQDLGRTGQVPEFTAPSVDLDIADGNAFALAATGLCKASALFRDVYEGGAVYLLLYDKRIDEQPGFDRTRLVRALRDLLSRYELHHRTVLRSYVRLSSLPAVEEGDQLSVALASGERLVTEFDDEGRLTVVNGEPFGG